jgi:myb proto-oncogene protein
MPVSNSSIIDYDLSNQTSFTSLLHPTIMNMSNSNPLAMESNAITNNGGNCQPSHIFQEFENFPSDLSDLLCVNQQQIMDKTIDGFYGMESMDISNGGSTITTTSTESTSWGDMNSLVYSPLVSDYEGCCQQGSIPQDVVAFEESRYFGMQ